MKNRVIEKTNNSYIYVAILAVYIIITILMAIVMAKPNKNIALVLNGDALELETGIIKIKGKKYITKTDIEKNFSNYVFYDKISRTLIITTWDEKIKIKKGDEGTIEYEAETVYSVEMLAQKLGYEYIEDARTNNIYIYDYIEQEINIKKSRTEVYDSYSNSVVGIVDKDAKISLLETEAVYTDSQDKYVQVKIEHKDKIYIARIRKDAINYNKKSKDVGLDEEDKIIMVCVNNKVSNTTDLTKVNSLAIDMLKLTSANKLEYKQYSLPTTKKLDVYAVINNGYESAGFDTNIITDLVHSDKNKEIIENKLIDFVMGNELEGIVIDFKKFKATDKDLLEQYIKELAVLMHANGKKLIVKMMTPNAYDIKDIESFVDYIIVQAYGTRTTSSKMAGSHSTLPYVKETINEYITKTIHTKLILEVPTYSILWTERGGTVINAETYSMKAAKKFISENGIKATYNEASGQNYVTCTKGIIVYKMWLEDEISIANKINVANEQRLAGISIYKSGEELANIYDIIK